MMSALTPASTIASRNSMVSDWSSMANIAHAASPLSRNGAPLHFCWK
jgi:hypothetical protein